MPYIKREDREKFKDCINALPELKSPGELNYLFTVISYYYLRSNGLSYQKINDVLGALDGAGQELYRKIAIPYEDEKIKENGDVNMYQL